MDESRPTAPNSDAKCAIARAPVTGRDSSDAVEASLAQALTGAAAAGQWALVESLAAELAARRTQNRE